MRKRRAVLLPILLVLFLFFTGSRGETFGSRPTDPKPVQSQLTIFALDIGQGDSELIVSPTGKIILIDAGNPGNQGIILAAIRRFTGPQCRIDLFIASHPHADHIGSAAAVIKQCQVSRVLDSGFQGSTTTQVNYLKAVTKSKAQFIKAEPDQNFDIGGGAKLTVLSPIKPFFTQSDLHAGATPPNANSVVVRLDYKDFSMLFTGDAEAETEARMIEKGANLQVKVLKVGHHGSRFASSEEFLEKAQPEAATISVGATNKFKHPTNDALARLKAAKVKVYRTDLQGEIKITSDGDSYVITPSRNASQKAIFTGKG
jgi:beta-lactamase superfamily II metal-dependent hydrolase